MITAFFLAIIGFTSCAMGMIFGGLFSLLFRNSKLHYIPLIFAFCSGIIFGLIFLDIIPESVEMGGWISTIIGLGFSCFLFQYLHKISHVVSLNVNNRHIQTGLVMAISIAIHNFPSGIALGAGHHGPFSNSMIVTMIFHTIPEGIAVFTPLFMARYTNSILLPTSFLVALPVGIGSFLGVKMGINAAWLLSLIISTSMGIVLLVTMKEIFWEALKKANALLCFLLTVLGLLIIGLFV